MAKFTNYNLSTLVDRRLIQACDLGENDVRLLDSMMRRRNKKGQCVASMETLRKEAIGGPIPLGGAAYSLRKLKKRGIVTVAKVGSIDDGPNTYDLHFVDFADNAYINELEFKLRKLVKLVGCHTYEDAVATLKGQNALDDDGEE